MALKVFIYWSLCSASIYLAFCFSSCHMMWFFSLIDPFWFFSVSFIFLIIWFVTTYSSLWLMLLNTTLPFDFLNLNLGITAREVIMAISILFSSGVYYNGGKGYSLDRCHSRYWNGGRGHGTSLELISYVLHTPTDNYAIYFLDNSGSSSTTTCMYPREESFFSVVPTSGRTDGFHSLHDQYYSSFTVPSTTRHWHTSRTTPRQQTATH